MKAKWGRRQLVAWVGAICLLWVPAVTLSAPEPKLRDTLNGHSGEVRSVAFSPDGKTLIALTSKDWFGTIKLWDVAAGKEKTTLKGWSSFAVNPDGQTLASGSDESSGHTTIKLWDVKTGKEKASVEWGITTGMALAFSPDGRTLAVAAAQGFRSFHWGGLALYEVPSLKLLATPLEPQPIRGVRAMAFSPDGKILAWGGIELYDVARRKGSASLEAHGPVNSLAFSPDGKTLASASNDNRIQLWNMATGKERAALKGSSFVFSPNGQTLASWSDDAAIKLWDVAGGKNTRTLAGHTGAVRCLTFSPDGKTLASGSVDKTIKLWDVAGGKNTVTLTGHIGAVRCLAFSPDGNTLASGSEDGTIKLWNRPHRENTEK